MESIILRPEKERETGNALICKTLHVLDLILKW